MGGWLQQQGLAGLGVGRGGVGSMAAASMGIPAAAATEGRQDADMGLEEGESREATLMSILGAAFGPRAPGSGRDDGGGSGTGSGAEERLGSLSFGKMGLAGGLQGTGVAAGGLAAAPAAAGPGMGSAGLGGSSLGHSTVGSLLMPLTLARGIGPLQPEGPQPPAGIPGSSNSSLGGEGVHGSSMGGGSSSSEGGYHHSSSLYESGNSEGRGKGVGAFAPLDNRSSDPSTSLKHFGALGDRLASHQRPITGLGQYGDASTPQYNNPYRYDQGQYSGVSRAVEGATAQHLAFASGGTDGGLGAATRLGHSMGAAAAPLQGRDKAEEAAEEEGAGSMEGLLRGLLGLGLGPVQASPQVPAASMPSTSAAAAGGDPAAETWGQQYGAVGSLGQRAGGPVEEVGEWSAGGTRQSQSISFGQREREREHGPAAAKAGLASGGAAALGSLAAVYESDSASSGGPRAMLAGGAAGGGADRPVSRGAASNSSGSSSKNEEVSSRPGTATSNRGEGREGSSYRGSDTPYSVPGSAAGAGGLYSSSGHHFRVVVGGGSGGGSEKAGASGARSGGGGSSPGGVSGRSSAAGSAGLQGPYPGAYAAQGPASAAGGRGGSSAAGGSSGGGSHRGTGYGTGGSGGGASGGGYAPSSRGGGSGGGAYVDSDTSSDSSTLRKLHALLESM